MTAIRPEKIILDYGRPLRTPVLYIVFKRLDMVKQSFEAIRKARPGRLYVASDGPRDGNAAEAAAVGAVRKYIMDRIDWDCEVKTLFRENNFGCNLNVTGAIDWFFANEEAGIVIEDDILPDKSFFYFCESLLDYYKDDSRIMFIGGMGDKKDRCGGANGTGGGHGSYHFVKTFNVWGWASWRRSWQKYDFNCGSLDYFLNENLILKVLHNTESMKHFSRMFRFLLNSRLNGDVNSVSWDFSVVYMMLINNGLTLLPNFNIVSNIGHGHKEGTYSQNEKYFVEERRGITEITHPAFIIPDDDYNEKISSLVLELEGSRNTVRELQGALDRLLEAYRGPAGNPQEGS